MTLEEMLNAMNGERTSVWLVSHTYGTEYKCSVEYEKNGDKFKVSSEDHTTPLEAVQETYAKFMALTEHSFKEARPAMLGYAQPNDEV